MSWSGPWRLTFTLQEHVCANAVVGFVKNVNRKTTQVMMKTGTGWAFPFYVLTTITELQS